MELEEAIRARRTHKAFRREAVDGETLEELFELARWAPNHRLTNPWRFRVVGPATLARLKRAAEAIEPGSGVKLERAPTLVISSVLQCGDPTQDREDLLAAGVATYLVLLAAAGRGLAGYWRTPRVLLEPSGREAVGLPQDEELVGLLYLGRPVQDRPAPPRAGVAEIVQYLP